MSHNTEEWCKDWRKTGLLFQKQQEFGEYWPVHSKFSTLIGSSCANYIVFDIKKYRGVIFRDTKRHWLMQNLKKNYCLVWKMTWEIWQIFTRALESLKNLHFNGLLLKKVCNAWAKKVQKNYASWHWKVMQSLKNWLAIWKMTVGIWQIFTGALESLKIGTFMGSFHPKLKMYELKIYRGVMYHGNEELCKIWRGIDSSFQNWHQNLTNFDPTTQMSQTFAL